MNEHPYARDRLDKETLPEFIPRTEEYKKRLVGNCTAAAGRARAYAKSARQSAELMGRAANYWERSADRIDIAWIYKEQVTFYTNVAALYDRIAEHADMLADLFQKGNDDERNDADEPEAAG